MELAEIEKKIAGGEMSAMQVFTQMKQHIHIPPKYGANHCIKHDGFGFVSDCIICNGDDDA